MRKILLATSVLIGASVSIAGIANAGTLTPNAPNPAPGSITVTLNALVEAFTFAGTDSGNNGGPSGIKRQNYGIASYARLYPSFDGVLANGIKYGGSLEIRQNSGTSNANGPASGDSFGTAGTFYAQREFIYIGADKFGKISLGTPVQPSELFQTGNEVAFNDGGWDGDLPGFFNGGGLKYMIDDDRDTAEKIVYVSPQYHGVDFGVSFEPNGGSVNNFFNQGPARISSGPASAINVNRRQNTVDAAIRYQAAFGPIGFKANGAASYGAAIRSTTGAVGGVVGTGLGGDGPSARDFSLYGGGAAITFAGFEVGAHVDTGIYGDDLGSISRGATGTTAYIGGGQYTVGPVVVGANYYGYNSGQYKSFGGGEQQAWGIAAGGTYTLAPGASIFLDYLFGQQHARGVDLTGFNSEVASNIHNKVRAEGVGLGAAFKW